MSYPNPPKETKKRYMAPSVNWGHIAVAPADLFHVYRELATKREPSIEETQGTPGSRTNALACILKGVHSLRGTGYTRREIAVILATVAAE